MDALTLVRQDHRKLEELLERCERLDGGSRGDRDVFRRFQAAIRHHVDQEETILYTIFRERARRAGVDLVALDRALEQHRLIDRLASELADPGHDGDTRRAKLTVLAERVRTHLDEDSVLLTAIEDLVDDDTLLEMGRRMEQRERVIEARRELAATLVPGGTRARRLAATLGGLVAAGSALFAVLARRRGQPPSRPTGRRRLRRR